MPAVCSYPNCDEPHKAKGYCKKHYHRLVTYGTVDRINEVNTGKMCKACQVVPAKSKGYCSRCYKRVLRYGSPYMVYGKDERYGT